MSSSHDHAGHHNRPSRKGVHKDWRVWVVVLLMLGAMAGYILSMDESLEPAEPDAPAAEGLDTN
ncbi:MAG: hypothetical protein KDA44_00740 [Planctomycetales bacterium]|nr:hypothetical protein [Planctomycetales bacterium]